MDGPPCTTLATSKLNPIVSDVVSQLSFCLCDRRGHLELVEELIRRRADVNKRNDDGFSPLFYAAQQDDVAICRALVQAGADPSIGGKDANYADVGYMCPVDFMEHSDKLRTFFAGHQMCTAPSDYVIYDNSRLTVDGELTFEVVDAAELSKLPIKAWKLTFFAGPDGGNKRCAATTITNFEYAISPLDKRGRVSCRPVTSLLKTIVLVADKSGPVSMDVQAVNVIGCSGTSEKIPIDMSEIFSGL